jgi:hypothetical protein
VILALVVIVLVLGGMGWLIVAGRRSDLRYEAALWDTLRQDLGELDEDEEE